MSSSVCTPTTTPDYSKKFSLAGRVDSQEFPYIVDIERNSLPWTWTEWCKENCTGLWGWWFDSATCYVGFMEESEACWFALTFKGDSFPSKE